MACQLKVLLFANGGVGGDGFANGAIWRWFCLAIEVGFCLFGFGLVGVGGLLYYWGGHPWGVVDPALTCEKEPPNRISHKWPVFLN